MCREECCAGGKKNRVVRPLWSQEAERGVVGLKDSPPGKYGLLTGSGSDVNIQALQAFPLHSGEAWRLHRCRPVIGTMRLTAAGEVHEPDQAGILEILGPGAEVKGQGEGEEERGQLSPQAPHSYCSLVPNPTMACGGDGLRGRASRFLRGRGFASKEKKAGERTDGKSREHGAEEPGGQGRRETQPKGLFFLFLKDHKLRSKAIFLQQLK